MTTHYVTYEPFEISPRFRGMLEGRIARLEQNAARDEAKIGSLDDLDHIRQQMRLAAVERAEALRIRIFLDRSFTRGSEE